MDAKLSQSQRPATAPVDLVEWGLLLAVLALFTSTETYNAAATAGLGLLALYYVEQALRGKLAVRRSGIEIPLLLFLASALSATLIAYNPEAALLQFARMLAAAALFFKISENNPQVNELAAAAFLLAASGLAIYWTIHNDFSASPGKMEWITAVGKWLNSWIPKPPGSEIHSNVAAGTLLVSLPFGAALAWKMLRIQRFLLGLLALICTMIVLFGLAMTSSRGAWVGLAALAALCALTWAQTRWFRSLTQKRLFWGAAVLLGLIALLALVTSGNWERWLGQIPDPTGTMRSRVSLWGEGLGLVRDYFFTGSGLQTHWMVHATYAIMIHVPFLAHTHNSFLQVWIEQGIVGALALAWGMLIVLTWAWQALGRADTPSLGWAGFAALFAAGVHGVVDVVFYIERTLPIVGFLLGFAALLNPGIRAEGSQPLQTRVRPFALLLIPLFAFGVLFYKPIAAAWQANLGALQQTRLELTLYNPAHFDNPTLDQVRQTSDMQAVQKRFYSALALQPKNTTALQRLAEIALARADYDQALEWMQLAWQADPKSEATRLLYGDALAAAGKPGQAAQVLQGLTWAESRLLLQAAHRYGQSGDTQRAIYAWQTILFLNPSNQEVRSLLDKAEQSLHP